MFPLRKWYALKLFSTSNDPILSIFPSQMVRLSIVSPFKWLPLYPCFPFKWYALKSFLRSNDSLYPCFPCKWYALKPFPPQMAPFIDVSLDNGTP